MKLFTETEKGAVFKAAEDQMIVFTFNALRCKSFQVAEPNIDNNRVADLRRVLSF